MSALTPSQILDLPDVQERVASIILVAKEVFAQTFAPTLIHLSEPLLFEAVESSMCDLYRLKAFRAIQNEDVHKQASFVMKWISKIRPIQLKPVSEQDCVPKSVMECNDWFAILIGLVFLKIDPLCLLCNDKLSGYLRNLAYLLHWHDMNSPEHLASELFLLDELSRTIARKQCDFDSA